MASKDATLPQLWVPPSVTEFKVSGHKDFALFVTSTAKVALGVFDARLCPGSRFHILGVDRLREFMPQSRKKGSDTVRVGSGDLDALSRFVGFLFIFWNDVLGRNVLPVFGNIKEDTFGAVLMQRSVHVFGEKKWGVTNGVGLELHDMTPSARDFTTIIPRLANASYKRIVCARKETLDVVPSDKVNRCDREGTLVLNSSSQDNLCLSFLTVQVSPSSRTILPNKIPRVYMLGIVTTYSKSNRSRQVITCRGTI